ncbi:hypothetical protein, partial [Sporisorium scitamineum]
SISRTFTSGVAGVGRVGADGVLAVGSGVGKAGLGVGKAGFGVGKGVVGIAGKGVGGVTKGVGSIMRPGGRKVSASEIAAGEEALLASGEPVTAYATDGLPAASGGAGLPANLNIPVPAIPEEALSRPSMDHDARSMAESQGTPSKRRSKLHNPFKRHNN